MNVEHREGKPDADDEWFEALGASSAPGTDSTARRQAAKIRAELLARAPSDAANTPAHQSAQLDKLMARLDAGGHFDAPPEPTKLTPRAHRSWRWWLPLPIAAAFGLMLLLRPLMPSSPEVVESQARGVATTQLRMVRDPSAAAQALCAQLQVYASSCVVESMPESTPPASTLRASILKSLGAESFLRENELLVDSAGVLVVEFRAVGR